MVTTTSDLHGVTKGLMTVPENQPTWNPSLDEMASAESMPN